MHDDIELIYINGIAIVLDNVIRSEEFEVFDFCAIILERIDPNSLESSGLFFPYFFLSLKDLRIRTGTNFLFDLELVFNVTNSATKFDHRLN